ncbi:geranylgeranyl reductase family protein [Solirhodobacter olei]|uniref:geranylgeranyl reductase family protein n=1 Tax=Solirhodobacter olei TaxID=2493082 RepID=UPI000FD966E8|nr:geranylgeranyl reductase family protein [Solirhodobacter olei]
MTAPRPIDVLVAGLGPAGAAAAAAAAEAGATVLAVDRRARPGLPVQCAEFVPMMLGMDTAAVSAARIQDIATMETYLREAAPDTTPEFRGHMIDRAGFDAALVAAARAAGADCRFATPIRAIGPDGTVGLADGSSYRPRVLIGADGPRSPTGRALGLVNTELVETRQITLDLLVPHAATDIFLRPEIEGGYGWLFPKGKLCNLGLGIAPARKGRLKTLLSELHVELLCARRVGPTIHATTGGAIPVGGIIGLSGRLGATTALLAGDAAGLVNPVTGAGINAAVLSGRMAGRAAAAQLAGDAGAAADYDEEARDLFGPSIALALRRRQELMAAYAGASRPSDAALRRGWIAYSDYWDRTPAPAETREEKEPA